MVWPAISCLASSGALTMAFAFAEAFILPLLATAAPTFVEGFLGIVNGHPGEMNLGALAGALCAGRVLVSARRPAVWHRDAPRRHPAALGGRSACRRGRGCPSWLRCSRTRSSGLLAVPMGLALAWLGYALWSERREHSRGPRPWPGQPPAPPNRSRVSSLEAASAMLGEPVAVFGKIRLA